MGMNTLFTLGGPVMYFLILLSIYALAVILYKIHVFRKVNFFESKNIGSSIGLWKSGNKDEAYDLIKKADHPVEEVVSFGMYQLLKNKKPTAKMEDELKEEIVRLSDERIEYYNEKLPGLEVIAVVSPLSGLLGTIFGMIQAFQQLELAGKNIDPAMLSGGIWEALLTTAVGLSIAIPVVIFHSWFKGLIERLRFNIESSITQIFTSHII
tara:strand:- start:903 stop:1532 length:630 start_codon:yes stop_codon:yes gene_type:complete